MSAATPSTTPINAVLQGLREHCHAMPPVRAMGIDVEGFDGQALSLVAPLALNINDKGNAFGGSLTSLMTLAGWGLVTLQLQLRGLKADVYVADSQVRYLAPVYGDLCAVARLADDAEVQAWDTFFATLAARGRARIQVQAEVPLAEGGTAATLSGRYVAMLPR